MQVSWIEPEQLRDLVGKLQRPAGAANAASCELHTLPDEGGFGARELGIDDNDLWLPNDPPPEVESAAPVVSPTENLFATIVEPDVSTVEQETEDEPHMELPSPPAQANELNRIREKLQAIRERAVGAGLLAHVATMAERVISSPSPEVESTVMGIADPPSVEAALEVVIEAPIEIAEAPAEQAVQEVQPAPLQPIVSPFALAESVPEAEPAFNATSADFEVPSGSITRRLEAFASWASRKLQLHDLIVVDDHGDVSWGDHEQAGLMVSAMMACKAKLRSSALGAAAWSGVIEQPISAGRMLIVIPCETGFGSLTIAVVGERSLPPENATLLRNALVVAVESRTPPHDNVGPPPALGSTLE